MGVYDIFRNKPWALEPLQKPWAPLASIHDHIVAHLDPATGSLPGDYRLPDDAAMHKEGGLRFAAGAMDGMFGHHAGGDELAEKRAGELVAAVEQLLRNATDENLRKLYALTTREGLLSVVDEVIGGLVAQRSQLDVERYHALAHYLVREAGHREAVKLGIAMLGLLGTPEDEALLMTLGACDEFTLFAAVALSNQAADEAAAQHGLFRLAQRTHGWGRVQVVERLASATDPEVRAWLLRHGFRNGVMYEYLACICARAGELSKMLANPGIDAELLVSAAEILGALVTGQAGPAEGIDDYEDASRAVASYLGQLEARRPWNLEHLIAVDTLREFLEQPDGWEPRRERGWTEPHRQRCLTMARDVLGWGEWHELALDARASRDGATAARGDAAARILGIDSWAHHLEKVEREGASSHSWSRLLEETDASRIDAVLALAARVLPLAELACGPAKELGIGKEFAAHLGLEVLVSGLKAHPGKGYGFVEAALRSPVTRGRLGALRTLAEWGEAHWPEGARSALEAARAVEPVESVALAMARVLRGESVDGPDGLLGSV